MFDLIRNTLRSKDNYLCVYDNKIYIYNFNEIVTLTDNIIVLNLNKKVIIKGTNLRLLKIDIKELLIEGNIERISYE